MTLIKSNYNKHDNIFPAITFDELITTLQSNYNKITSKEIYETIDIILKAHFADAMFLISQNLNQIIKDCKTE